MVLVVLFVMATVPLAGSVFIPLYAAARNGRLRTDSQSGQDKKIAKERRKGEVYGTPQAPPSTSEEMHDRMGEKGAEMCKGGEVHVGAMADTLNCLQREHHES